jgi:hypothetical protein
MSDDSAEMKLARAVTSTLILVGLATSLLGVIALVGWVF